MIYEKLTNATKFLFDLWKDESINYETDEYILIITMLDVALKIIVPVIMVLGFVYDAAMIYALNTFQYTSLKVFKQIRYMAIVRIIFYIILLIITACDASPLSVHYVVLGTCGVLSVYITIKFLNYFTFLNKCYIYQIIAVIIVGETLFLVGSEENFFNQKLTIYNDRIVNYFHGTTLCFFVIAWISSVRTVALAKNLMLPQNQHELIDVSMIFVKTWMWINAIFPKLFKQIEHFELCLNIIILILTSNSMFSFNWLNKHRRQISEDITLSALFKRMLASIRSVKPKSDGEDEANASMSENLAEDIQSASSPTYQSQRNNCRRKKQARNRRDRNRQRKTQQQQQQQQQPRPQRQQRQDDEDQQSDEKNVGRRKFVCNTVNIAHIILFALLILLLFSVFFNFFS